MILAQNWPKIAKSSWRSPFKWSKHRFTGRKSEHLQNIFGNLRTSSEIFGHLQILSVPYEKSWHSQDKNVTPMNHKKLAGIFIYVTVQFHPWFKSSFRHKISRVVSCDFWRKQTSKVGIWGPVLVKITLIKFIKSELIKLFVQLFLWYFTNNYIYSSNYFYVF